MTPQSQWTDSPDRDIRVCFVGDSFVAGIGDSTGLGWVGRVTAAGLARGLRLTTYNLGVRRETSVQIGQRLVAETTPRLAAAEDPRIVISCGVNDTMHEQEIPRVPLSETVRALRNMHEVISPTRLLLIGPPAVGEDEQNDRIKATNTAMREEAERLIVPFVDCFEATSTNALWRRQVSAGDGYHPDAAGYELLAQTVTTPVLDWLNSPSNHSPLVQSQ